jgi:hypothetical protein
MLYNVYNIPAAIINSNRKKIKLLVAFFFNVGGGSTFSKQQAFGRRVVFDFFKFFGLQKVTLGDKLKASLSLLPKRKPYPSAFFAKKLLFEINPLPLILLTKK